jgi:serpin B
MNNILCFLALAAALLSLSCSRTNLQIEPSGAADASPPPVAGPSAPTEPPPPQGSAMAAVQLPATNTIDTAALVNACNDFAMRLQRQLVTNPEYKNNFVSPFSIALALAMTYNGARGQTATEMAATLGFPGVAREALNAAAQPLMALLTRRQPGAELYLANSLWARADLPFKPDFLARVTDAYAAEVHNIDFLEPDALKHINDWVSAATKNKIQELIKSQDLTDDTLLILINAIYFKGTWQKQFDAARTQPRDFTSADGAVTQVPMMTQQERFPYNQTPLFQIIRLAYADERLGMYILLPPRGAALDDILAELTPQNWHTWTTELRAEKGTIVLPKFTLMSEYELNEPLCRLGMPLAFDRERADFFDMATMEAVRGIICIDKVRHKAFVDVNEEGTEAAAATSVGMVRVTSLMPEEPFEMIVDHPFLFAICDRETDAILFLGTVNTL